MAKLIGKLPEEVIIPLLSPIAVRKTNEVWNSRPIQTISIGLTLLGPGSCFQAAIDVVLTPEETYELARQMLWAVGRFKPIFPKL